MSTKNIGTMAVMFGGMLLSACGYFYGGGWAYSMLGNDGDRVTFGVEGGCQDVAGGAVLDLDFTMHDRGFPAADVYNQNAPQKKHFAIFSADVFGAELGGIIEGYSCAELASVWQDLVDDFGEELPPEFEPFFGAGGFIWGYCPQGVNVDEDTNSDCGIMFMGVEDTGNVGPDKGDTISVLLLNGYYSGYFYTGELEGGNITVETFDPI